MKSDIDIAQQATMRPITELTSRLKLTDEQYMPYGRYIAKLPLTLMDDLQEREDGKLILVTAMTPPKKGAGKTTTTIGLTQALAQLGKNAMAAIREPSLGPCMGMKGGAAGGGYSQVLPMEDINLHFTGDIHAVSIAHNMISAIIDNHLHQKNSPELNPREILWKRVIDMNDRSLRSIIVGLEGQGKNGVMREDGFEITAASEIMAILCLANSLNDLKDKVSNIIIGYDFLGKPIFVRDLGVAGAATALLKNALNPNLVQTIEGSPVLIHGGPFANIAHGCNSLIATKMALKLADYTVTEAGFGADLGAEKFFDIKCRQGNLKPSAAVLVVPTAGYDDHGIENIVKHVENLRAFRIPVVVSINKFATDTQEKLDTVRDACQANGINAVISDYREGGGAGGIELAEAICNACQAESEFRPLYKLDLTIREKVEAIATRIYGAAGVEYSKLAEKQIKQIENLGYHDLPVCISKTPASLSDNAKLAGCPQDFTISVNSAKVSAGAGFVVIYTGTILTMPGLPKQPSALNIDIDRHGTITGLF